MTKQSLAQPAPRTSRTTREDRARELAARHFHEIAASRDGFDYLVPSCTGEHAYRVHYDPAGESWCECPDWQYRSNVCKHCLAVALIRAGMVPVEDSARVDEGWMLEASELTGFECRTLADAFLGLPRERRATAAGVLKHAIRVGCSVGEQEERVRAWAKRNGRGMYHPAILDAPPLEFGGDELQGV